MSTKTSSVNASASTSQKFQSRLLPHQRGVFTKAGTIKAIKTLLDENSSAYYYLEDTAGHVDIIVAADILLPLIGWMQNYPKMRCKIDFLPNRRSITTGHKTSIAALSDGDVLAISRVKFLTPDVTIHVYNQLADGSYIARRGGAPMRTVRLDEMTKPYEGLQWGSPPIAIMQQPRHRPDPNPDRELGSIDVVYTWVDSQDPVWQENFSKRVGEPTQTTAASALRYLSRDELRYSLRSIKKYAPWVRNIYIVTDDQTPSWFKGSDDVKIISHKEIFPDPSVLPVFNSHAIESCLHRIPGLSEHFIYFNDDVFLGKPVKPTEFFNRQGDARLFFSPRLSFNDHFVAKGTLPTDAAFRNTISIIEKRFNFTPIAKVMHTPHPMLKSVLEMIEEENAEEIARTRAAHIRSETDLNVTGNLAYYYYFGCGVGVAPLRKADLYKYFDTGRQADMMRLFGLLKKPAKLFCLNLTFHEQVSLQRQALMLKVFFKLKFWRREKHEHGLFARLLGRGKQSQ